MPTRRQLVAASAGAMEYLATLYRFLSYSERNRLSLDTYLLLAALVLVTGFVVTLGATSRRYRTAGFVILGIWVAHALVVAADLRRDPTDHNLLPFEFIILGLYAVPAYVGAALGHLVDYVRLRRR